MAATTIILAEDHNLVREGLKRLIEAEPGFKLVGSAADGLGESNENPPNPESAGAAAAGALGASNEKFANETSSAFSSSNANPKSVACAAERPV